MGRLIPRAGGLGGRFSPLLTLDVGGLGGRFSPLLTLEAGGLGIFAEREFFLLEPRGLPIKFDE